MKLYTLVEIPYEYDDSSYSVPECCDEKTGTLVKAYRSAERAVAECERLNREKAKENATSRYPITDYERNPVKDFYRVVEVEADDEEVVGENSYEAAVAAVAEAKRKAQEAAKIAFRQGASKLFEENADLHRFSWTQYTCYFADGDPTYFSAHIDEPAVNGEEEIYDRADPLYPLSKKVAKFLGQFDQDDLEFMFGDHAQIIVERGLEPVVEEYAEHD